MEGKPSTHPSDDKYNLKVYDWDVLRFAMYSPPCSTPNLKRTVTILQKNYGPAKYFSELMNTYRYRRRARQDLIKLTVTVLDVAKNLLNVTVTGCYCPPHRIRLVNCFPTPDLIAWRCVKYALEFNYRGLCCQAMMELGACVSLLMKCHPLGHDRMQHVLTKVARLAKVTGRRDCKTFSLASTCHFNLAACFWTRHLSIPCSFCFSQLHDGWC